MQELLKIIAQGLVEKPEEVSVTLDEPGIRFAAVKIQGLHFFQKLGGITPRFHAHFAAYAVRTHDPSRFQKLFFHVFSSALPQRKPSSLLI